MDAEEIEQELIDREYRLMYYMPENVGSVSPWYVGPAGGDPDGSDTCEYRIWRENRRKFVATGDVKYKNDMEEFVSMDNPPLVLKPKPDTENFCGWAFTVTLILVFVFILCTYLSVVV